MTAARLRLAPVGETMFPPRAPFFGVQCRTAWLASRPAKPASGGNRSLLAHAESDTLDRSHEAGG
jgi:hypothetical protein